MTKALPTAWLLALALAGCGPKAEPANVSIDNDAASPAAGEVATGPDAPNAITAAAENAATVAGRNGTAALPTRIPAAFQGRWGLSPADCTTTQGDDKGLLTIGDTSLKFYEARGTLDHVLAATATSFDARYNFEGEGQEWKRTERFKLNGDSMQRRTDAEPGQEPPVNLTYRRC